MRVYRRFLEMPKQFGLLLPALLIICLSLVTAEAQQSAFTYQGKLTDNGSPANGNYDLQFALYDSPNGGAQVGQTQTATNVSVSGGVFTTSLDFGPAAFPGAVRFLEISARPSGAGPFTLLTPRQKLSSTPYAVRSLNASNADSLGGIIASNYPQTNDPRLTDSRSPTAGSSNYIQNTNSSQTGSNFNISGNGTAGGTLSAGVVNAATQYNINGNRAFGITGGGSLLGSNTFAGAGAGALTLPSANSIFGNLNSFFGNSAGTLNSSGAFNSFFGWHAGANNTTGGGNTVIGGQAGLSITTGNNNTFVGMGADGVPGLTNATAIGVNAKVSRSDALVLGDNVNVGIGTSSPNSKLQVAGTVESTAGGFKFPDGSVQSSAAYPGVGKIYTTGANVGDIELVHGGNLASISALTLPPGVYLVTATVLFENRTSGLFQDNTRVVRCTVAGENIWVNRLGAPNNPMDYTTMTLHTVVSKAVTGDVDLACGISESAGNVFVRARRLTALRVADNPN
jgi:hypothetical protein